MAKQRELLIAWSLSCRTEKAMNNPSTDQLAREERLLLEFIAAVGTN